MSNRYYKQKEALKTLRGKFPKKTASIMGKDTKCPYLYYKKDNLEYYFLVQENQVFCTDNFICMDYVYDKTWTPEKIELWKKSFTGMINAVCMKDVDGMLKKL
jgi:hypothetical protein